jgi:hypothetical protein
MRLEERVCSMIGNRRMAKRLALMSPEERESYLLARRQVLDLRIRNLKILIFYGVHLYFVEDALDSAEPWFENAFHDKAKADAQYSVSLGIRSGEAGAGAFLLATIRAAPATGTRTFPPVRVTMAAPPLKVFTKSSTLNRLRS